MSRIRIFLAMFAVMISLTAIADVTLPKNCEAGKPSILSSSLIKKSDIDKFIASGNYQSAKTNAFWIAYSDRENNVTYVSPDGGTAYKKLDFNEEVKIAKISNGYALVYTEPKRGVSYPHISEIAESKGWIPMKRLLLWQQCPTNDRYIYNKALIVMNLDDLKESRGNALCYKDPSKKTGGQQLFSNLEFYFVMKEEGDMALLATQYKMDGTTDQNLYGWVNKSYFISWDQRSCLEPTWDPEDAEYFSGKNIKATVYDTPSLSNANCVLPFGQKNGDSYRISAGVMRFPILDNNSGNNNVFYCEGFGGVEGHLVNVPTSGKGVDAIIEKRLNEQKQINIIIVIDGTNSMKPFYDPIQQAIKQANTYFGDRPVKVGVVIYRDYEDGQFATEYQPMTRPNDPNLAQFLTNGGKYGIKSVAKSWEEALYKGLDVALDAGKMGYSPRNSNLMFVVGDCGNHLEDSKAPQAASLIDKMVKNNIQLTMFQVRNENQQAFLLFRKQMNDILKQNLEKQYKAVGSVETKFHSIQNGNGYEFEATSLDHQLFIGSSHHADTGREMPSVMLYELIKMRYEQFNNVIDTWLAEINNAKITIGGADNAGTISMGLLKTKFTPEEIKELKRNGTLLGKAGYTPKKDETGRNIWKPVLYISSEEFVKLLKGLKPVADAAVTGDTDRMKYVNAIKSLIKVQIPDLTEDEMNCMSVEQLTKLIGGLQLEITAAGGRTLLQIQDKNIVSQAEYDEMVSKFRNKYNKLAAIHKNPYKWKVARNGIQYYWLPAEDLP